MGLCNMLEPIATIKLMIEERSEEFHTLYYQNFLFKSMLHRNLVYINQCQSSFPLKNLKIYTEDYY